MLENQSMNLWTISNTLDNVNTQKLTVYGKRIWAEYLFLLLFFLV